MEATESSYNEWDASRTELQDDKFTNFQGTFANATASGSISKSSMVSYFGRINYDFASKYMFSINFRRDGLSALSRIIAGVTLEVFQRHGVCRKKLSLNRSSM